MEVVHKGSIWRMNDSVPFPHGLHGRVDTQIRVQGCMFEPEASTRVLLPLARAYLDLHRSSDTPLECLEL